MKDNVCAWPTHKASHYEIAVIYYGRPLCDNCWTKYSALPVAEFKKKLGIKPEEEVISFKEIKDASLPDMRIIHGEADQEPTGDTDTKRRKPSPKPNGKGSKDR